MAKKTEEEKLDKLKQHAHYLMQIRPSVFRTGAVILTIRIVCSLASLGAYAYGIYILVKGQGQIYELDVNHKRLLALDSVEAGVLLLALGILLNVIAWLSRLIRNRNWYILESYEVIEWVGDRDEDAKAQ